MSDSLQPCEPQHARLPCPSLSPRDCSNSCSWSRWCFCHPLLILVVPSPPPSIFPSIRVFSNESALWLFTWPKYWSFSFSISPSKEYSGLISFRITGLISMQSKGLSRVFSSTTVWKHQLSHQSVKPHPQTGLPAASVNTRTMFPVLRVKNLWVKTHIQSMENSADSYLWDVWDTFRI